MSEKYPNAPGSKSGGASKDAAEQIVSRASMLRSAITNLMSNGYRLTADEIANHMRESVLAIRPRVSELVKTGVLIKLNERRKNVSGMTAHVLRHKDSETAVALPEPTTTAKPRRRQCTPTRTRSSPDALTHRHRASARCPPRCANASINGSTELMKKLFLIAAAITVLASPAVADMSDPYAPNIRCNTSAFKSDCWDRNRNVAPITSGEFLKPTESAEAIRLMAAEVYGDCRNFTGHIPPTHNWALVERFEACRKAARR